MTLVYVGPNALANYTALSTDIVSSRIVGASRIGNTVLTTDDSLWWVIKSDLTLETYGLPVSLGGSITIGSVDQGNASLTEKWLVDGSTVTQPVSGTFWQATQPVSGPLTDAQIRATALPISGTVTTGGLTDTQLRATPVPISGSVTVDSEFPAASTLADTTTNPSTTVTGAMNELYNNSSWDRQRNNHEVTALSSAARTSSLNSSDLTNYNFRGAVIVVDITALSLTGTLVVSITGKDSLSGKYYPILTGASLAATGTTAMIVYPGVAITANVTASMPLPRIWRVEVTAGNGVSITYSIGVNYIL